MNKLASAPQAQGRTGRCFTIVKVLLFCMPFLCLAYLTVGTSGASLTADGVLSQNPSMAVSFLSAMLQPYAAWIVILSERRLADGRAPYAILNLTVLLAAELMLMSSVGAIGMAVLLFQSVRQSGLRLTAALRQCRPARLFAEAGGSLLLLPFAGLCLIAMSRIGMAF